jgi:HD-like signal output (HDOD) protein
VTNVGSQTRITRPVTRTVVRGRDAVHARLVTVPTVILPRTRQRLGRMLADGAASVAGVVDELARDPLLTASLLGQSNLAAADPGLDPGQALASLGFGALEGILTGAMDLAEAQRRPLAQTFALAHATAGLMQAMVAYRATRLPRLPDAAVLTTLGMLHDLGTAAALLHLTPAYARASLAARAGQGDVATLLDQDLGLTDITLGGLVASAWSLPEPLATIMAWHLRPMDAPAHLELTALVHTARILAGALGFRAPGDRHLTALDPRALQVIGLGSTDLERILHRVQDDLDAWEIFADEMVRDETARDEAQPAPGPA